MSNHDGGEAGNDYDESGGAGVGGAGEEKI